MSCWDDEAGAHESPLLPQPPSPAHKATTQLQEKGAFGAHPGHDAHILSTLSAIQVLATHEALSRMNVPRAVDCTSHPPYVCVSYTYGTDDGVCLHCSHPRPATALGCLRRRRIRRDRHALHLLRRIRAVPPQRARPPRSRAYVSYLASCRNFDGGFGRVAGSESHAAQGMCLSLSLQPRFAPDV